MVMANFPFYLKISWKKEKDIYKIQKINKIMDQIRGEKTGGSGENFLYKAFPLPSLGKSEMAPLSAWDMYAKNQ